MKRVLTAAVLAPTVLYIVLAGPPWSFFALVSLVAGACYWEYCAIAGLRVPEALTGIFAGTVFFYAPPSASVILMTLLPLLAIAFSLRIRGMANVLPDAAIQAFGFLYVYGAWKTAFSLHAINPYWLTFGLAVNWIGDTGAYYFGRRFGKHKMAPVISPGKTWEGAAASMACSVLFAALVLPRFIPIAVLPAIGVAMMANAAGQFGDLAESAIKRGAGVKDSGKLLPGHGGMLDRVDCQLFSLPILYAVLYFTGIR